MVGLMGLTFFCNKCVEVFFKFRNNKVDPDEFEKTCKQAIASFKSLKWPKEQGAPTMAERAIFNTNEEIDSLEHVIEFESENTSEHLDTLDTLIKNLEFVLKQDNSFEQRKEAALKLQHFFDILGDYSFYATRDSLRVTNNMSGV